MFQCCFNVGFHSCLKFWFVSLFGHLANRSNVTCQVLFRWAVNKRQYDAFLIAQSLPFKLHQPCLLMRWPVRTTKANTLWIFCVASLLTAILVLYQKHFLKCITPPVLHKSDETCSMTGETSFSDKIDWCWTLHLEMLSIFKYLHIFLLNCYLEH